MTEAASMPGASPGRVPLSGIGAVDLMIGFPQADTRARYDYLRAAAKDSGSQEMDFPAGYMFKDVPGDIPADSDPVALTLAEMDFCGVSVGLIGDPYGDIPSRALSRHPDRFVASFEVDPNDISGSVRSIRRAKADWDIKAVTSFPAGCSPQVPISDRRYYPIYQTCVDLGIPIVINAGIAGPRVPSACQEVMHFDQVCYDFGGKILDLRVTAIDGFRIVTQDAEGRVFRFGGVDAFAPGVWEGNHSTVSAELFKR